MNPLELGLHLRMEHRRSGMGQGVSRLGSALRLGLVLQRGLYLWLGHFMPRLG